MPSDSTPAPFSCPPTIPPLPSDENAVLVSPHSLPLDAVLDSLSRPTSTTGISRHTQLTTWVERERHEREERRKRRERICQVKGFLDAKFEFRQLKSNLDLGPSTLPFVLLYSIDSSNGCCCEVEYVQPLIPLPPTPSSLSRLSTLHPPLTEPAPNEKGTAG